jgi:hypothetical protein
MACAAVTSNMKQVSSSQFVSSIPCIRTRACTGPAREGSRPARLLHMARRAERGLASYERTGWLDGEPARVTGRLEIRPAAELGPIIVCLDTSGSMAGARETVAKARRPRCPSGQRPCAARRVGVAAFAARWRHPSCGAMLQSPLAGRRPRAVRGRRPAPARTQAASSSHQHQPPCPLPAT